MPSILGLTIETVSRQMTALRKDGIIELQGARSVAVTTFDALAALAGRDEEEDGSRLSRA